MNLNNTFDVSSLADIVRRLWRNEMARVAPIRLELYLKVSRRVRVSKGIGGHCPIVGGTLESGIAARSTRDAFEGAGFSSSSGHSADIVRQVVEEACTFDALVDSSAPELSDGTELLREDLDAEEPLPEHDALCQAIADGGAVRWIEAGTTIELLGGAGGWLAVRRRNRIWASLTDHQIVAQRGFGSWHRMLRESEPDGSRGRAKVELSLAPSAAAPVVSALAAAFHGPDAPKTTGGAAWDLADDPSHPQGLFGGSFDDAGFPTSDRKLAAEGAIVGRLEGPGCYRRMSFRAPPIPGASNLVMTTGSAQAGAEEFRMVRSNVFPVSPLLWVLQFHDRDGSETWIRTNPRRLLNSCVARCGQPRVTSYGPITPTLIFEGLT